MVRKRIVLQEYRPDDGRGGISERPGHFPVHRQSGRDTAREDLT